MVIIPFSGYFVTLRFIRPLMSYATPAKAFLSNFNPNRLHVVENKALRIIGEYDWQTCTEQLHLRKKFLCLKDLSRFWLQNCTLLQNNQQKLYHKSRFRLDNSKPEAQKDLSYSSQDIPFPNLKEQKALDSSRSGLGFFLPEPQQNPISSSVLFYSVYFPNNEYQLYNAHCLYSFRYLRTKQQRYQHNQKFAYIVLL